MRSQNPSPTEEGERSFIPSLPPPLAGEGRGGGCARGGRLGALLLALTLTGCATTTEAPKDPAATHHQLSVCLVTLAGPENEALNQAAVNGIAAAPVASSVIESPVPTAYAANLERCASGAPDLVVALSPAMAMATWTVAQRHPALRFALVDAHLTDDQGQAADLPNVTDLLFKEQEAGYLVGILAGMMETIKVGTAVHNRLGALGMKGSPASQRYLGGFIAGARSVDPNVGLRLDWTQQNEQAACKAIGAAQVHNQVDVLFAAAGACGPGYIEAAYDGHAYAIGSDADQASLSPAVITSAVKRIDRALQLTLQHLAAGTFSPGPQYFGLADDAAGVAQPSSVVPQAVLIQLSTARTAIVSGAVIPPADIPPDFSSVS